MLKELDPFYPSLREGEKQHEHELISYLALVYVFMTENYKNIHNFEIVRRLTIRRHAIYRSILTGSHWWGSRHILREISTQVIVETASGERWRWHCCIIGTCDTWTWAHPGVSMIQMSRFHTKIKSAEQLLYTSTYYHHKHRFTKVIQLTLF